MSELHLAKLIEVSDITGYYTAVIVVQSLNHVWIFATSWNAAHWVSLSFTVSWSLLKLMTIDSVMPSNHLILCHPLLLFSIFPSIKAFPVSQLFASGGQRIGTSASVLPSNEYLGLISFIID